MNVNKIGFTALFSLIAIFGVFFHQYTNNIKTYLNGDMIADGLLQYTRQKNKLQNEIAPYIYTRTVAEIDSEDKLDSLVVTLQDKVQDRIDGTIELEKVVKSASATSNALKNCQNLNQDEDQLVYTPFYQTDVNFHDSCWAGSCRLDDSQNRNARIQGRPTCQAMILDDTWTTGARENLVNRNEGGAWQYFGSEAGGFTVFPAHLQDAESANNYDPRLRDWYINALVPTPLDVVVVIDKSGSMFGDRMQNTRLAVKKIIKMLRPTDRIGVVAFDDHLTKPDTGIKCQKKEMAFATNQVKSKLSEWVSSISTGGGTSYNAGINGARKMFTATPYAIDEDGRKKILVFLSDGVTGDDVSEAMTALNSDVPGVVVMAYGLDMMTPSLTDMVSLAGAGDSYKLTSSNIEDTLGRFYSHKDIRSPASDGKYQTRITMPYVDSMGMGLMVTASKAVYDSNDILQGVVGYDLPLNYLFDFFQLRDDENPGVYGFLLNGEDGSVIYHHKMSAVDADLNFIDPVSYKYFEPFPSGSTDIIEEMLNNPSNFSVFEADLVERYKLTAKENGLVFSQEYNSESQNTKEQINVKCRRASFLKSEVSWIMCAVTDITSWANEFTEVSTSFDLSAYVNGYSPKNLVYHNFTGQFGEWKETKNKKTLVALKDKEICSHGYRNSFIGTDSGYYDRFDDMKKRSAIKWSPRQFTHPMDYKLNDIISVLDNELFDQSKSPARNSEELKASIKMTKVLDKVWKKQNARFTKLLKSWNHHTNIRNGPYDLTELKKVKKYGSPDLSVGHYGYLQYSNGVEAKSLPVGLWRYFGAIDGSFRILPAVEIADNYDPTLRPWYLLAMTNPDQTFITPPYIDAFGMGMVVTISRAIRFTDSNSDKKSVLGVLATDYPINQIADLVLGELGMCRQVYSKSGNMYPDCMIIDSTGAVIYWSDYYENKKNKIPDSQKFIDQFDVRVSNPANGEYNLAWALTDDERFKCLNMISKSTVKFRNLDETQKIKDLRLTEENPCGTLYAYAAYQHLNIRICKLFKFNVYVISEPINGFRSNINKVGSEIYSGPRQNYKVCENTINPTDLNYIPVCQKIHPFIDTKSLLGNFTEPGKMKTPGFENENKIIGKYSGLGKINARINDQCYPFMEEIMKPEKQKTAYGRYGWTVLFIVLIIASIFIVYKLKTDEELRDEMYYACCCDVFGPLCTMFAIWLAASFLMIVIVIGGNMLLGH